MFDKLFTIRFRDMASTEEKTGYVVAPNTEVLFALVLPLQLVGIVSVGMPHYED